MINQNLEQRLWILSVVEYQGKRSSYLKLDKSRSRGTIPVEIQNGSTTQILDSIVTRIKN